MSDIEKQRNTHTKVFYFHKVKTFAFLYGTFLFPAKKPVQQSDAGFFIHLYN